MTRDEIAKQEVTRDPIFLFQRSKVFPIDNVIEFDYEKEMFWIESEKRYISEDDAVQEGFAVRVWETLYVWFTREEAEAYYRPRYHTEREGKDWRVFCTCAEGELCEVLKSYDRYTRDTNTDIIRVAATDLAGA